jgi:hypothetical protein
MKKLSLYELARHGCPWVYLVICLAVLLAGCQPKGPPLSKEAQAVKKVLLEEMNKLTTALREPVAQQDWPAVEPILQTSQEEMKKRGQAVPATLVVIDRNGITQGRFPGKAVQLDFMNYTAVQKILNEKKDTQAMLYLGGRKIFFFAAPILQKDQVVGAVGMGFPEEELQKWKLPEKEFLSIDFNQ